MGLRRLLAASVVGVLAAGTPALLPANLWAAPSNQVLLYTADANGDKANGVDQSLADGSSPVVVAEPAGTHYDEIDAAPVGEAIAYTRYIANTIGLFVDNRGLTAPHALYGAHLVNGNFLIPYYPSFSPDGRTLLFSVLVYNASNVVVSTHLETVSVGGGRSTPVIGSTGLFDASYDPSDSTQIAASRWAGDGAAMVGRLIGSSLTAAPVPGTADTDYARFSPDGQRLVFVTGQKTLRITSVGGTVLDSSVGGVATYPVWQDDTSVLVSIVPVGGTNADIYRFDHGAAAPAQVTNTPTVSEWSLATPRAINPAPTAPTALHVTLAGTRPVLRWIPPIDGDVTQVVVRRAVGTTPPVSMSDGVGVPVVAGNSVTDTVTFGQTYSYAVFAVDSASQVSPAATITAQALGAPSLSVPARVWVTGTSPRVLVHWASANGRGSRYRLSWGLGSHPTSWRTWLAATTATSATFGASNIPTVVAGGKTYSIRAQALDAFGNVSGLVTGRLLIPADDGAATYGAGWLRVHPRAYWGASAHTSATPGARAAMTFVGSRIQVIAGTCATCGSFHAFMDGHLVGTFSTHAATAHARQLVFSWSTSRVGTHRLLLVNLASRGHPTIAVDAFAITR